MQDCSPMNCSMYIPAIIRNKQEAAYKVLGFQKCEEVSYPPEIEKFRITNPDAPYNHYYVEVEKDGVPAKVMMVLFGSGPYEGGSFFKYLQTGLMEVEESEGKMMPSRKDELPIIHPFKEVENLFEQIGRNTNYNIHPEEISAEHFVKLLYPGDDLPDPQLIDGLQKVLLND